MSRSLAAKRIVEIENLPTLADGLAGQIDDEAFEIGRAGLDEIVTVSEAEVVPSVRARYAEVRDMTQILTSFCARLYGRRPARSRAEKALRCAARGAGPGSPEVAG